MNDVRVPLSEDPRMDRLEEILREFPERRQELLVDNLITSDNTEVTHSGTEVDHARHQSGEVCGEE